VEAPRGVVKLPPNTYGSYGMYPHAEKWGSRVLCRQLVNEASVRSWDDVTIRIKEQGFQCDIVLQIILSYFW
jgi:hypothetical protein